jgi:predicted Rossmann fold flavoprotein
MEIVGVLRQGLDIRCGHRVVLEDLQDYDAIVVTTGGSRNFSWLESSGVQVEVPVPSLFPFRLESSGLEQLSGALVEDSVATIAGTKFRAEGITLITHNGVSGPCILRLSSYAARHLSDQSYQAPLVMNWLGGATEPEALELLHSMSQESAQKLVCNTHPLQLTSRHWEFLVSRAGIGREVRWSGVGRKQMNRLASVLTADRYQITGRVPHKEEFVTAGGVSLRSVDSNTLECKTRPGLYFAGELLDVDGVTGGFNLQAAWTMADAVARALASRFNE